MCRRARCNQRIDPVGDFLGGVAELVHGPVGGVALGHVPGPGMVDEALCQAGGQHQLAVGDGNEAVAQCMEPEPCPARLADAGVEMPQALDMAGPGSRRREHPGAGSLGEIVPLGAAALEDLGKLAGDGKLQRLAGLGLLYAEHPCIEVDLRPAQPEDLGAAHAGVEAETEGVAGDGVAHRGLEAPVPTGQDLGRRCDAPAPGLMQPPASGLPLLDGVMEPGHVDALAPVEGVKHPDRAICLHPPGLAGEAMEELLHILARNRVQRPVEPIL